MIINIVFYLGKTVCYTGSSKELFSLTLDIFQRRLMFSVPRNSSIESVDIDRKDHQFDHRLSTGYYASLIVLDTFNGWVLEQFHFFLEIIPFHFSTISPKIK